MVGIQLNCSIPSVEFDLIDGLVTVGSINGATSNVPKYGLIFSGTGIVEFASTYNMSLPELSPHVFQRGILRLMLPWNGTVPHFIVRPNCDFAFTIPELVKRSLTVSLPHSPQYPVKARHVTFSGESSINITPLQTELVIGEITLNEHANVTFSSLIVNDRVLLKRGARIGRSPDSAVAVAPESTLRMDWRNHAVPRIDFRFVDPVCPDSIEMHLDFTNDHFIDIDDYIHTFFSQKIIVFSGIPSSVCNDWTSAIQFVAVNPLFNGTSCILSLECIPSVSDPRQMSIAMTIREPVPTLSPIACETPTPLLLPANGVAVISVIVIGFGAAAVLIAGFFLAARSTRLFHITSTEYDDDIGMTYI
jgi:hypothetical protein